MSLKSDETAILERHNKALSTVSHDLKSPMVAIIGFTKFLGKSMQGNPHDPQWVEILKRIQNAGEGMLELIETILAMAKMEAGRENVDPEWVDDLEGNLRMAAHTFEYEATSRELELSVEIPSPLPKVRWDMNRLRYHVVNNVLSNSLKFTRREGHVRLSAVAEADRILIRISNTGPAIPPGETEKIFCRFGQGDMGSERVYKGSGLGLYNARLFVERHGGTIRVERSDGEITTFLIDLPVDAASFSHRS